MEIFSSERIPVLQSCEGHLVCGDEARLAASLAGYGFTRNLGQCLQQAVFVVSFLPVRYFSTSLNKAQGAGI
jgi:hypothetical protein